VSGGASVRKENIRGLTILIAAYNASDLIEETLRRIIEMEKVPDLPWEVLLIDNNSTDDTVEKARRVWGESTNLRILGETQQGTGYAKFRGLKEAKYAYVGFVDQDNWLDRNWMLKTVLHLDNNPEAALICGKGTPIFETEEPAWFQRFQQNFAVGPQAQVNGLSDNINQYFYNAASIIRKSAFDEMLDLGFFPIMKSRTHGQLLSGEDTEVQAILRLLGWQIHYQDDIKFEHFMPKTRLTLAYFRRFREGLGASSVYLGIYRNAFNSQTNHGKIPVINWRKALARSFVNTISDPAAIIASLLPKYASNYRVAKYWSRLGEFRERVNIGSQFDDVQEKLIAWLEKISGVQN